MITLDENLIAIRLHFVLTTKTVFVLLTQNARKDAIYLC